jgi:hypothetical protein
MKRLSYNIACWLLLTLSVCAADPRPMLFFASSDGKGEVAQFSKKALFDRNDGDKIRYGEPFQFIVDSIKIWTFEGDGDRVTMYTVGIAGTLKNNNLRVNVLLKRAGFSYLGQAGNAGVGASASKGIDELLLESGQSYIIFQLRDKDEAIAVAHELASLLK